MEEDVLEELSENPETQETPETPEMAEPIDEFVSENIGQIIISGDLDASQYDSIAEQILSLQENGVSKILFEVNSSGGDVLGIDSLIQVIRECPISTETLIIGMCASSAYWIASQTDRIVANGVNVLVGSIGVFSSMISSKQYLESIGIQEWTVVSEGSPKKIAQTEEDFIEQEQPVVDEIFENFVTDVANGRGLTVQEVKDNFGEGALLTAKQALEVGMIDAIFGAEEKNEEEIAEDNIEDLGIEDEMIPVEDISASKNKKRILMKKNPKLSDFRKLQSLHVKQKKSHKAKNSEKGLNDSWQKDSELVQIGPAKTISHIQPSFYAQYKKLLNTKKEKHSEIF